MDFISSLGAFVLKQAADWRVFHEAERQYLKSPAGFMKSCSKGIVHWAFASLFAIYFGVSLLYDGRMTEIPAQDILSTSCIGLAGFLFMRLVFDYCFKRLSMKRILGYLLGAAVGAAILIWNLPDLLQFSTKATISYLAYLLTPWSLSEFVAFSLGPLTDKEG